MRKESWWKEGDKTALEALRNLNPGDVSSRRYPQEQVESIIFHLVEAQALTPEQGKMECERLGLISSPKSHPAERR